MKKLLLCVILIGASLTPIHAKEEATKIAANISINDTPISSKVLDDSVYTSVSFNQNDVIRINSDQKIKYIYIKYASTPTPFIMSVDGKKTEVATQGFLHELISLSETSNEVVFNVSAIQICDIFIFSNGELPSYVQKFNKPYEKCDMLVLPTHADDDTLYFGIPITMYADKGYRIQIVYLTNHNNTVDRPHELLDGLWEMGITSYPVISDFKDIRAMSLESALAAYDEEAVLKYEVENIRRFKPSVILGHDEKGEYGHGVHMLNTHLLKKAINLSGDKNAFVESASKYGVWTPSKTYLHMYPLNTIYLDENTVLRDGTTSINKAKSAFTKHLSQQKWDLAVLPSGTGDCRKFGLYQTTVGNDTTKDLFEHVELSKADIKVLIKESQLLVEQTFIFKFEKLFTFLKTTFEK